MSRPAPVTSINVIYITLMDNHTFRMRSQWSSVESSSAAVTTAPPTETQAWKR